MARPYHHQEIPRDNYHRRPSAYSHSPLCHSTRSWTSDGVHFTVKTSSYASPGVAFGVMSGGAHAPFGASYGFAPRGHQPGLGSVLGNGLLGTALGLVDGFMSLHDQPSSGSTRQTHHAHFDASSSDEDDAEEHVPFEDVDERQPRPRSMFSRFKDKLREPRHGNRNAPYSRESSPAQRPRTAGRREFYCTEERRPAWAQQSRVDDDGEEHFEDVGRRHRPTSSRNTSDEALMIKALERAADFQRKEIKSCQKQLERASRQPMANPAYLQVLLDKLKLHQAAHARALRDLQNAKEGMRRTKHDRHEVPHLHEESPQGRRPRVRVVEDDFVHPIFDTEFGAFSHAPPASHPLFAEVEELRPFGGEIFGIFGSHFHEFVPASPLHHDFSRFFAMPGNTYTDSQRKRPRFRHSSTNTSAQFETGPSYNTFTQTPPRPPPTVLTPDEAKTLLQAYNDRWNKLAITDPNIPYPTRGLHAAALLDRDTLWAPLISAQPSTWSEESVMQANAQAFFLGVVGLSPQYRETAGAGRIAMGFDKSRASPAQVQSLLDLLKKEKVRWHSDKLGRRTGGSPGVNEILQRDERARAVFHAVCELMQVAQ